MKIKFQSNVAYIEFCNEISLECNQLVHAMDKALSEESPDWLIESIPSYSTLAVEFDPRLATKKTVEKKLLLLHSSLAGFKGRQELHPIRLPVMYGGENGPDIDSVSSITGLSYKEIIAIHTGRVYTCYMLGFTPGFVYLGDLDPLLAVPRLDTPRLNVPEGSVAIAARQTGIYGIAGPGGWRVIGRLQIKHFDLKKSQPSMIRPGDKVAFYEVK
ncbi:MAG: 5-oxoprolinase subunit PxpB [Nitrososphaerota archaeon]